MRTDGTKTLRFVFFERPLLGRRKVETMNVCSRVFLSLYFRVSTPRCVS